MRIADLTLEGDQREIRRILRGIRRCVAPDVISNFAPKFQYTNGRISEITVVCETTGKLLTKSADSLSLEGGFKLNLQYVTKRDSVSMRSPVAIDHIALVVRAENFDAYRTLLVERFKDAQLEIFEQCPGMDMAELNSYSSDIHIAVCAPSSPKSHLTKFLSINRGEGLQHVAVSVSNIELVASRLYESGIEFVSANDRAELSEAILRDRRPGGFIHQIFSTPIVGGAFLELIERHNASSFSNHNIQQLFSRLENSA